MADKTQNVKTRLSFDGEAEYKAACKEINSTLKVLNSEMKLVTAEYKDNASSVDALKAKQAVLQKTYDEQAKKVKETEAALEKCRKATGDNSEESKKLETQLNYQKAALVKTEQELGKTTDEMEKAEKAAAEAARFGEVSVIGQTTPFSVPDEGTLTVPEDISYLYYCQNETVHGLEFNYVPKTPALSALVSDISSNFMTRYVDFTKHDLVFAGAQKNFGPAGLTVVIIRKSLLGKALSTCPTMLDYAVHAKAESMYNTPPVFPIYVASLVCRWIASEGGIAEMNRRAIERSSLVYGAIDASDGFYINRYRACERSRMNVVFTIKDPSLNEAFLRQAAERDLTNLKGHRILGGFRASLYNAMPVAGARALAEFMRDFAREHG